MGIEIFGQDVKLLFFTQENGTKLLLTGLLCGRR